MAAAKIMRAKRGFTCDAGAGPVLVPRVAEVRGPDGELYNIAELDSHQRRIAEAEHPEWFDRVDEQPVIVRAGDRYPSDHAIVKGREDLFEEAE